MNNQGQAGQQGAAAGQAGPGAQRQAPMYRPEMMRNLPILNDEEKAKYERGLRQLWNHFENHPEDSAQHQDAKKKIQDFTKMLLNKLQQRRLQVQQQQQAQQAAQQQQPQQAGQQSQQTQAAQAPTPQQQPQQAQPQAQQQTASQNAGGVTVKTEPKTESTPSATAEPAHAPTPAPAPAAAPTPAAAQQPQSTPSQFPEHILAHIRQMTFNPPMTISEKGAEAAQRWSNDFKAKYLRALMQMDNNGNQMKRIDTIIKERQDRGSPYSAEELKQIQIRREHAHKMYQEAHKFVDGFRKSQENINKQRAALAGQAAAGAQGAARPPQQQQQAQQQQQQAQQQAQQQQPQPSPAVAAAQTPATQAGAQASPVPAQAGTPSMQTQNTAVNAAIEAAKNQQMAAAAAGRATPQNQQAQQAHQAQQQQQAQHQAAQQQAQQQQQQQQQQHQAPAQAQAPTPSAPTPTTQPAQPQQPATVAPQQHQQQQAMAPQGQQQPHPPPVNTAIASVSAGGGLPSAGTPTQNRVATPQSAAPLANGQALSHSAAVSRANQRVNSQVSIPIQQQPNNTPGSAGAQGVIMGANNQHAHPTQPTQTLQSKLPIPKQLPEKATAVPQPVAMSGGAGAGRPTYTGGSGIAGGVMGQPAMAKIPAYQHEAEGDHVLSKKKLDELVRQVCGGTGESQDNNMLMPEVEESVLTMADSFVDNVLETACRNAKERGSKVLEIRDIQLVLERTYNIRVPGYSSDELRAVRKFQPSTAWITKMSAIQAAKVTSAKGSSKTASGSKGSKSMATKSPSKNGTPTKASSKSGTPVKARSQKSPSPTKKAPLKSQPQSQTRQQISGPELIQYPVLNDGQNSSFAQPHDNISMEISWK
ncbi:Transcription initiation factor TFIID subunit 12 [Colletotrichum sp. SAR 10_86]|nr:Transcription initiation factor TFIID subunit 12 [Colletotrichum sp. SAR 10_75]KAI8222960.1 Transcription initiation factor TFIID subunit 12 [Colletotrichum sp. SAR 10_86]